jgi:hypothetical protein
MSRSQTKIGTVPPARTSVARLSRVAPYDPKRCTNPQGPVAFYGPGISSYSTNATPDLLPQNSKNFLHFLLAVVEGVVRGDLWDRNLTSCLCNVFFRYTFALQ